VGIEDTKEKSLLGNSFPWRAARLFGALSRRNCSIAAQLQSLAREKDGHRLSVGLVKSQSWGSHGSLDGIEMEMEEE